MTSDYSPRQIADAEKRTRQAIERGRPKDYRRKNRIGEQFVVHPRRMLESYAYRALSLSAYRVLARIEIEQCTHAGLENGNLPVTYEDFVVYGIDRHAIGPAIRENEALGFLEVTERGRAGNREHRKPSKYRLTYLATGRADPTHEWDRIKTKEGAEALARASRKSPRPKTFYSGGLTPRSMGETPTENGKSLVGETPTTVSVGKTPTTIYNLHYQSSTPRGRRTSGVQQSELRPARGQRPQGRG
jgi:hypothetical protein